MKSLVVGNGKEDREIGISNPDKLLFPKSRISKYQLADYYRRIGPFALPFYQDRALTMQRFPDGLDAEGFFQKTMPDYFPDWIDHADMPKEGGTITHVVVNKVATLVYLADQACITPHVALSRIDKPDYPDRMVFDLDPSSDDFDDVRLAALALKDLLFDRGWPAFVKTTGSRGLHVEVPLDRSADFDTVRHCAKTIAGQLVEGHDTRFTLAQRKEERGKKVFIDYLRNGYGQTTVAPYGVRAIEGAPVATPLTWDEVEDAALHPQRYTIKNIFRRLGQKSDPWADFFENCVTVECKDNG